MQLLDNYLSTADGNVLGFSERITSQLATEDEQVLANCSISGRSV